MVSKKVGVWVPHEEVWEEFSKFVELKWGKKHSRMGMELEEAIKKYMASPGEYEELKKKVEEVGGYLSALEWTVYGVLLPKLIDDAKEEDRLLNSLIELVHPAICAIDKSGESKAEKAQEAEK